MHIGPRKSQAQYRTNLSADLTEKPKQQVESTRETTLQLVSFVLCFEEFVLQFHLLVRILTKRRIYELIKELYKLLKAFLDVETLNIRIHLYI